MATECSPQPREKYPQNIKHKNIQNKPYFAYLYTYIGYIIGCTYFWGYE